MRRIEPRKKAQQSFEEANLFIGSKETFHNAFPEIEEFLIEYVESGRGVQAWQEKYPSGRTSIGEFMDCSNPLCRGGFRTGELVREMVGKKETFKEGSLYCFGREGSPKGRRLYGHCNHHIDYKITIKYRATPPG